MSNTREIEEGGSGDGRHAKNRKMAGGEGSGAGRCGEAEGINSPAKVGLEKIR